MLQQAVQRQHDSYVPMDLKSSVNIYEALECAHYTNTALVKVGVNTKY